MRYKCHQWVDQHYMFCTYIPTNISTCHISTCLHVNQTCLMITRATCLYVTHVKISVHKNPTTTTTTMTTTTTRSPENSCNKVDGHDEAPDRRDNGQQRGVGNKGVCMGLAICATQKPTHDLMPWQTIGRENLIDEPTNVKSGKQTRNPWLMNQQSCSFSRCVDVSGYPFKDPEMD